MVGCSLSRKGEKRYWGYIRGKISDGRQSKRSDFPEGTKEQDERMGEEK